jgi:signal transduction histidine kinase
MKIASMPLNEAERIAVLKKYAILDTEAEKQFDDLTQLASFICGAPISLVSLVDSDRQWFKSRTGLNVSETPRDIAFCAHAILEDEVFVVSDATKDERFYDNPLVLGDLALRFYAGAPLIDKSGHKLGSLCVIDHTPRELSAEQREALAKLSRAVVAQMELRLLLMKQIESEALLKKNSMQMIHSAKMSTLGEMASGVAHEINNPLAIIQGKVFVLRKMLASPEKNMVKIIEELNRIDLTSNRIAKIVKGLLNFSRETNELDMETVNLQNIINDILVLFEEKLRIKDIELRLKKVENVEFPGRSAELSQALLNIINNAYDAIGGSPDAWIEISAMTESDCIFIAVTDSGKGISPQVADKMMQPFFSTKDLGNKTGLGLSISKGLIEGHKGELFYDSSSPHTKFVIRLPVKGHKKSKAPSPV